MITVVSQHVDTFKESLYFSGDTTKYNSFVNELIGLKDIAQKMHDNNNDLRFVVTEIGGIRFHVMATAISHFSVVIKNNDISIALAKKDPTKKGNMPSIKVEYRASFLVNYGLPEAQKKVSELIRNFFHSDFLSKVQEIHVCSDIQGHTFSLLDFARFKNRSAKSRLYDGDDNYYGRQAFFSSRRLESLYFGSSNNMLRIYDKTKEIKDHPDSAHIERLWRMNKDFDEYKDVWRIEFQIRRPILKTMFTQEGYPFDYTSVLLDNLGSLWSFFVSYFQYKDIDRDKTLSIIEGIRFKKDGTPKLLTKTAERAILRDSQLHPVWEAISSFQSIQPEFFFRFRQVKESNPIYAMNAACALISTTVKHYGEITPELISQIFDMAEERSQKNHDINLVDNALLKTAGFLSKVEKQRSLGLDVVDVNDMVTDNLSFYCVDPLIPIIDSSQLKKIF